MATVQGLSGANSVDDIYEAQAAKRNMINARLTLVMRDKILKVLNLISAHYLERVLKHADGKPMGWFEKWSKALYTAQIKEGMTAAAEGWDILDSQMGLKAFQDYAKKTNEIIPDSLERDFIENTFFTSPARKSVDDYFKRTSRREANTYAKKLDDIFKRVSDRDIEVSIGPEPEDVAKVKVGSVPAQLSKELQEAFPAMNKNYANMISRTGTIWASNEGIMGRFISIGIKEKQWYANADERLCPFCDVMHGQHVSTTASFVPADGITTANKEYADGEIREIEMGTPQGEAIMHPPRHPNCRCTLVAHDIESSLMALLN